MGDASRSVLDMAGVSANREHCGSNLRPEDAVEPGQNNIRRYEDGRFHDGLSGPVVRAGRGMETGIHIREGGDVMLQVDEMKDREESL